MTRAGRPFFRDVALESPAKANPELDALVTFDVEGAEIVIFSITQQPVFVLGS